MSPRSIIRCSMLIAPPIKGKSDCRSRLFHSEFYFDQEAFRRKLELRDSYGLLQRLSWAAYDSSWVLLSQSSIRLLLVYDYSWRPKSYLDSLHHWWMSWYSRGQRYCKGSTDSFQAGWSICFSLVVPSISEGHGPHFIQEGRYRFDFSLEGASIGDAPRRCGAMLQPLSPTAFGTEAMSYLGCFVPHIRGLLLWPTPLDHGLPHPLWGKGP